ncbi:uncharacterized protein LOC105695715 [Orussus abietinus]|uniref:uncharacterized protein LOC105695715 n=1 Tax=Orussus abietinus TaxID=222816 RepID=UPI000625EDC5|nr:uncharacterized protein LOC105695715 [Orussus abietinus]
MSLAKEATDYLGKDEEESRKTSRDEIAESTSETESIDCSRGEVQERVSIDRGDCFEVDSIDSGKDTDGMVHNYPEVPPFKSKTVAYSVREGRFFKGSKLKTIQKSDDPTSAKSEECNVPRVYDDPQFYDDSEFENKNDTASDGEESKDVHFISKENQSEDTRNRDHDYICLNREPKVKTFSSTNNRIEMSVVDSNTRPSSKTIDKDVSIMEKSPGRIKDISELKKVIPRVKLLSPQAQSLNELKKLTTQSENIQTNKMINSSNDVKQQLRKYCRTCAGSKLPLVDIFSERGLQMRLEQQMRHLEEINQDDSLSTQMCMDCICDLKMSYKFFMQIKKAEIKLRSICVTLNDVMMNKVAKPVNRSPTVEVQALQAGTTKVQQKPPEQDILQTQIAIKPDSEDQDSPPSFTTTTSKIFTYPARHKMSSQESIDNLKALDIKSEPEDISTHQSDDNESIEEFDPDDPCIRLDSSDPEDEQVETKNPVEVPTESIENVTMDVSAAVECLSEVQVAKPKLIDPPKEEQWSKTPSILKRKAQPPPPKAGDIDVSFTGVKETKIPKLTLSNTLNVAPTKEDGIMYVTVKGSKPNELLLVKVKKMDKPAEKSITNTPFDIKPVEKILRKYEALSMKEKELFPERVKKPDIKEQIIEEQIEEYKKKREKVLGVIGVRTGSPDDMAIRIEDTFVKDEDIVEVEVELDPEDDSEGVADTNRSEDDSKDGVNSNLVSSTEKTHANTVAYLSRLTKLRKQWEKTKKMRDSLQRRLDRTYDEGGIERLERILGDREKNLQDFQDYLKQRKIVVARLKDEDIISLYEKRSNARRQSNLSECVDELLAGDTPFERDLEDCDYCPLTFSSKDALAEHVRTHDYKIQHYCEDCNEEFTTNKAKRNHNVVCIKKLICQYCDVMLDSKGKKRRHEQKHCDNMFGQLCDVCGEKFKHQGTLDQHLKTQHMDWEKIFQCPKCPKKFAFKQKLTFHLKSVHTTLRAYLCEDCGADFKNPASLRHHRIRKHQAIGNKRECPVCHKLVPFYSLSKHMHTHKAYTIQCPHCEKMFKNTSTLKQHIRIHEDQRQYRCETCGVGFNRRDGLRLHTRVHLKADSRGLKECSCQVCGEKFPNHSMLVIHRNRLHKDGRQYTCHICNRSMISTRSLEWHMAHIHHEEVPGMPREEVSGDSQKRRVSCHHCNKTFKTEMILRTHIKNSHTEKEPTKCLDCDLYFTSEVRLRHHMMVAHNRLEGTLACPHCPKRFVNQLRLKTHMISHSEERPYTCEICGFNLKTKIQLIKHHQNRHSDERPLQCRYCPWRCKQVSALVCHERTHTNERPYSCSVCRQRFKYLGDKNKHERRHESLGGSGFKRIVAGRNGKQSRLLRGVGGGDGGRGGGTDGGGGDDDDGSLSEQERDRERVRERGRRSRERARMARRSRMNAEAEEERENDDDEDDDGGDEEETGEYDGEYEHGYVYEPKEEEEDYKDGVQVGVEVQLEEEGGDEEYNEGFEGDVKFEAPEYERSLDQEYEETSQEASDAAEVILNMEETSPDYTEEVTTDDVVEATDMITDQILPPGAVVHMVEQRDDNGKIQVIPVVFSLPDLEAGAEVNLATASIMYSN